MENQLDSGKKTRLQYYDGWHSEYIYFSSLLQAPWGGAEKGYNATFIEKKKEEAINDARQHLYLPNMDADKSFEEFSRQFQEIRKFLHNAYHYEQKNEESYFYNKYKELIDTFSEEEREQIPALKECIQILKDGKHRFNYKKFITLVNILQTGLDNTKTIAKYEANRIKKIEDTLDGIINKKNNQTVGLADKRKWVDRDNRINKINKKFQRNIEVEYIKTGQLNKKDETTGRYYIRGAYAFSNIQQTAERELGKWAEEALKSIQNNKVVIAQLAEVIMKQYPIDGDFNKLTNQVRRIIIMGVLYYGKQHLKQILNHRMKPIVIDDMIQELTDENNHIFDMVQEFNLEGLPEDFGQNIQEAKLAREISDINNLANSSAEELYRNILNLIKKEESIMENDKQKSSYLILAMKNMNDSNLGTKYDETLELVSLVEEVRRLLEELQKITQQRRKKIEEYNKEYEVKTHSGKTATVKIIIKDGKPEVDMSALNKLVTDTNLYKKSNATSLSNLLRSLTTNASKKLRTNIIESLNKAHDDQLLGYSEQEILKTLDSELKTIDIKIDGPKLEEFFAAGDFTTTKDGKVIWNGRRNNKNDVVTIKFGLDTEMSAFTHRVLKNNKASRYKKKRAVFLEQEVFKAQQELVVAIQKTADRELYKVVHNNNQSYSSSERYSFMSKFTPQNAEALAQEYNGKDEPIAEAWKKLQAITKSYKTFIHNMNEFKLERQIEKRVIKMLSNSLQISTTVKAYNTYNNKIGFVGGSLGSNLQTQINTIADIFRSAGLPLVDLKWLYSAILNCAPTTVVGEANKSLIESYLGAVAAFALFDEGGTESMYISKTYETFFNDMKVDNSQKILHLYKLNGIYVPGSYVIMRTINTLEKEVLPQLASLPQIMHRGAGITILNTANMGDITGNNERTWADTGKTASEHVQLKILFLAQFLDIVNSINKELGNMTNIS